MKKLCLFVALLVSLSGLAQDYYVSTTGDDNTNNGESMAAPFKTIQKALNSVSAGSTVYIEPGTYKEYLYLVTSGTLNNRITIRPYLNATEKVIISGENSPNPYPLNGVALFRIKANNITVKDLEFKKSNSNSIYVGDEATPTLGTNVSIEGVHIYEGFLSGISFLNGANGRVSNCTIHDLYDYAPGGTGGGGDADGIVCSVNGSTPITGVTNHIFENNLIYNCSDDGIDTWNTRNNIIRGNVVRNVGYTNISNGGVSSSNLNQPLGISNGNGYKLGYGGHNTLTNNIAYNCRARAFDSNSGPNNILYNNTATSSPGFEASNNNPTNYYGFFFETANNDVKNNISTLNNSLSTTTVNANNSWNLNITDPQFINMNPEAPNFLHLSPSSPAINVGVNVGLPYSGSNPDIGAKEYISVDYYVATNGSNSNSGTSISDPFLTVQKALDVVAPGGNIYIRGGVYKEYVKITTNATSNNPITITSYAGETAIVDGSDVQVDFSTGLDGIALFHVGGNHMTIKNIEVRNSSSFGIYTEGADYVKIDNVHVHNGYLSGIALFNSKYGHVVNCKLHDFYDYNQGGTGGGTDADGISSSGTTLSDTYNTIENNLVYNCSDDGIDVWNTRRNTIKGNVVRDIGYSNASNGGSNSNDQPIAQHIGNAYVIGPGGFNTLTNNVAFDFNARGFDGNSGGFNQLYNNTAALEVIPPIFDTRKGFYLNGGFNIAKNNISRLSITKSFNNVESHNSWNLNITDPIFASIDSNSNNFLHLASNSPAIDVGTNVGLPFNGAAPDLGAYEYVSPPSSFMKQKLANNNNSKVTLYPNPSTAVFKINTNNEIVKVEVFTIHQKALNVQRLGKNTFQLIEEYRGVGIVKIETQEESYFKKIIFQ